MTEALRFLALAELLGLIGVPVAAAALGRLPGVGLGFAKPLGVLVVVWLVWLLAAVGVPFGLPLMIGVLVVLAVVAALAWLALRRRRRDDVLRRPLAWWSEGIFVVAFAGMALLSSYSPDVWGTEKPMDMAIVNAINASDSLPPHDPWYAGDVLDGYYYVGHLVAALFIRLTGVEPTAGYNLALALTFALAAVAAFSLGAATAAAGGRAAVRTGLAALVLCLALGNLAAARTALRHDGPWREYDWFAAARVIPDTINEFPLFSWILGDLHAHLVAVPFTFLALAFALQLLTAGLKTRSVIVGGIVTGSLYTINSWSYPVAAGLILLAGLAARSRARLVSAVALLVVSLVAILPFLVIFDPPARGLGFVDTRRAFTRFLGDRVLIEGLLLWLVAAAIYGAVRRTKRPLRNIAWAAAGLAFVGAAVATAELTGFVLLAALLAVALLALFAPATKAPERFVWLLIAGGLTCLTLPEVVYVRDEFDGGALARMNTVFKFGYQAWLLLAVAGAACLAWSRDWLPRVVRYSWLAIAAVLAAGALAFPVVGTYARKEGFTNGPRLNGMGWLPAGDVAAIEWLRDNADGGAVVLESAGDDYSAFGHGRISTFTGRAAPLGWAGHVLQWGQSPGSRRAVVDEIYRTTDITRARRLLDGLGVDYAVLGGLEQTDHGDVGTAKWPQLGRPVFERDGVTIYDVSR